MTIIKDTLVYCYKFLEDDSFYIVNTAFLLL